jgi:hypothetical protein
MSATGVELRSGDILFTDMDGIIPGLLPVGAGQALLFLTRRWWRMTSRWRTWWTRRHVAVVDRSTHIIQAMPKGCERIPLDPSKHLTRSCVYIRPDYALRGVDRYAVADAAIDYVGTPYNFFTYAKLAAGAFRMRFTEAWLRKHMSTRKDMMCSQHADQSQADAGWHVFDDGRLPQDVVPAELFSGLLDMPGWFMIPDHPTYGQWTANRLFPEGRI